MEKIDRHKEFLERLTACIESESIGELDFDQLRATLSDVLTILGEFQLVKQERDLFREDIIKRLSGMEKAIAVARRSRDGVESALLAIEELSGLDAEQLLSRYRKAQARMRDTFPASFADRVRSRKSSNQYRPSEYK
ncbi:MAG: hypothetical protein AB1483_04185 [Candidatus Zixiibacteriota bacterium]